MEHITIIEDDFPVGLIDSLVIEAQLVGTIDTLIFYDQTNPDDFSVSQSTIHPSMEKVKIVLGLNVPTEYEYKFKYYLTNYAKKLKDSYKQLNKNWSLEYDQCK